VDLVRIFKPVCKIDRSKATKNRHFEGKWKVCMLDLVQKLEALNQSFINNHIESLNSFEAFHYM